jgi:hypothetical protein
MLADYYWMLQQETSEECKRKKTTNWLCMYSFF